MMLVGRAGVWQLSRRLVANTAPLHPALPARPPLNHFAATEGAGVGRAHIDPATIEQLERISLVDFGTFEAVARLEEAILLAEMIRAVDTADVEPLYSLLEDETLLTRPDCAESPDYKKELLKLATVTEEDYFVAPPGNQPLSETNTYERPETAL